LINSTEEFQLISCTDSIPVIDFNTCSLLIAHGVVPGGVSEVFKELVKTNNTCSLKIDVQLDITTIASSMWYCVYVAEKLNVTNILLDVNIKKKEE
jgi:hypothetical protein